MQHMLTVDETVQDADRLFMRTQYDIVGPTLTPQQEKVILFCFRGIDLAQASKAVGMPVDQARELMAQPHVQALMSRMEAREARNTTVTRERLTVMLFDAHSRSANATEEITAIRELGKLHDLYPAQRTKTENVNVNLNLNSPRAIEQATDAQLVELAGEVIDLDPSAYEIVHEPETAENAN